MPILDEGLSVSLESLLDPSDFDVFINPKLHRTSVEHKYEWEHCLSFPSIRCMVKRPVACNVSYINEEGDLIEETIHDFKARVFLHELDHINGKTMTNWRVSEGNIDVLQDKKETYQNLMTTVDFYKAKIDDLKAEFSADHPVFADGSRKVEKDGQEWREFIEDRREEITMKKVGQPIAPAFEDSMLIDLIRAMRRDRREHLRNLPKTQANTLKMNELNDDK